MAMPISHHAHPKIIEITFSFPEFAPACKISVHSTYSFLRYSQFRSQVTRLAKPIFDHIYPKKFWSTFNLCEFVPTCKKAGYSLDLLWRNGRLKNPAIWLAKNILAHISGAKFSQIWNLCRNTANNISFHYRTNSVIINAHFWSIFPNSGAKKVFKENPALSRTTLCGFLAPCRN